MAAQPVRVRANEKSRPMPGKKQPYAFLDALIEVAAKDFFIVDAAIVKRVDLERYSLPILKKQSFSRSVASLLNKILR